MSFIIARYLLSHLDEIRKMNIHPWPKDKPYNPGFLSPQSGVVGKEKVWFSDLLYMDSQTPFNWRSFFTIAFVAVGVVLFWSAQDIFVVINTGKIDLIIMISLKIIAGIFFIQTAILLQKNKPR